MRREALTSAGGVLLAFLASQHHVLHMLLFALGLGGAGMSLMTGFPLVRRAMLLMSLAMVGVIVNQARDPRRPLPMRVVGAVSILLILGLVVWSVLQFGV